MRFQTSLLALASGASLVRAGQQIVEARFKTDKLEDCPYVGDGVPVPDASTFFELSKHHEKPFHCFDLCSHKDCDCDSHDKTKVCLNFKHQALVLEFKPYHDYLYTDVTVTLGFHNDNRNANRYSWAHGLCAPEGRGVVCSIPYFSITNGGGILDMCPRGDKKAWIFDIEACAQVEKHGKVKDLYSEKTRDCKDGFVFSYKCTKCCDVCPNRPVTVSRTATVTQTQPTTVSACTATETETVGECLPTGCPADPADNNENTWSFQSCDGTCGNVHRLDEVADGRGCKPQQHQGHYILIPADFTDDQTGTILQYNSPSGVFGEDAYNYCRDGVLVGNWVFSTNEEGGIQVDVELFTGYTMSRVTFWLACDTEDGEDIVCKPDDHQYQTIFTQQDSYTLTIEADKVPTCEGGTFVFAIYVELDAIADIEGCGGNGS